MMAKRITVVRGLAFSLALCGAHVAVAQNTAPTTASTATSQPATTEPTSKPAGMLSIIQTLPDYTGDWRTRKYLTGDWGGARTELAENGILFDIDVAQVLQGNAYGGKNTKGAFEYGGSADLALRLDTARMGLWPGGLITLHGETEIGRAVNGDTGSLMSPNLRALLPVPGDPGITTLSEFYILQALSEKVVLAAGKMDLLALGDRNAFAGDTAHTTQFMNTAFQVNPVLFAAVPYTAMAAGVILIPTEWLTVSTLVADNDPDGAATRTGFNTAFHGRQWSTVMQEYDLSVKPFGKPGHQRIGWFYTTKDFTEFEEDPRITLPATRIGLPIARNFLPGPLRRTLRRIRIGNSFIDSEDPQVRPDNYGMFYNFDQYLVSDARDPTKGWGVFGRFGLVPSTSNLFNQFYSIGLGGKGTIQTRDNDTWGVGYYLGNVANNVGERLGLSAEQGVEMFYNIEVTPWLHITPDVQVIVDPGAGFRDRDPAIVYGLRARINF